MRIKITEKNSEKIEAELEAVNGKAKAKTVCTFEQVSEIASQIEEDLAERGLPKTHQKGAVAWFTPNSRGYANSYRGMLITTQLKIERAPSGFFLRDVARAEIYPNQREHLHTTISKSQATIIVENALATLTVEGG